MADEKETLAENLDQVISEQQEPEVEPTKSEESTGESFAEKEKAESKVEKEEDTEKKEKAEKENNEASESEKESCEKCEEKVDDTEKEKVEDNACGKKMAADDKEKAEKCEEKESAEKCESKKEEKQKDKEDDKPLTKSERKTYQANEKSYQAKIEYLKGELAAYKPYKAMYEEAEKEIKELLEYKEEAELVKLEQQKSDYFKTFGMADFDDDDRDEIIKKINDYDFSYQDFKAFMADKVQKYGMKSRFQNITDIINMYADNQDVAAKYAESEQQTDEDKVLDKYMNI